MLASVASVRKQTVTKAVASSNLTRTHGTAYEAICVMQGILRRACDVISCQNIDVCTSTCRQRMLMLAREPGVLAAASLRGQADDHVRHKGDNTPTSCYQ